MCWQETDALKEREKLVLAYKSGHWKMVELARQFGVSPKTGFKWVKRFDEEGGRGLEERSRAPKRRPHALSPELKEALLKEKARFPRFGAPKLRARLVDAGVEQAPSISAIQRLLEREGLVKHRRKRRKSEHPGKPYVEADAPNDVWATDFKGEFKTKNGVYCYPLTVMDVSSRYILKVKGLLSTKGQPVKENFEDLFRRHGMPKAILSDNGAPFATVGLQGFSRLSVWWLKLGIKHLRTEPSSPQQNGVLERMHKDLKEATALTPAYDLGGQQRKFNEYRREYNEERPHASLDDARPAGQWRPSDREFPAKLPEPEYLRHWTVRKVSSCGSFRFNYTAIYLSQAFSGEWVALEEVDDGIWNIHFYNHLLARFDERETRGRKRFTV